MLDDSLSQRAAAGTRPRALLIAPIGNALLDSGAGQRTHNLFNALAELYDVDLLLMSHAGAQTLEAAFPALFESLFPAASHIFLRKTQSGVGAGHGTVATLMRLPGRIWEFAKSRRLVYRALPADIAFTGDIVARGGYRLVAGRYLLPTVKSGVLETCTAPVFLDIDDRDEKVFETRLASPTSPRLVRPWLRWHLAQIRTIVPELLGRFHHVWLASAEDAAETQHRSKSSLPNIPYLKAAVLNGPQAGGEPDAHTCLFVGTYIHRVNREGLLHFVDRCWGRIRAQVPAATLRVVGSGGWENERGRLEAQPGVTVVGGVDDLAAEYRRALFCVAPLLEGGGTKIKVLESLAYQRPVVSSAHSIRGLSELTGDDGGVLVAADDEQMVAHCVALFNDPRRAAALAAAGARTVQATYSPASFLQRVRADVEALSRRA